MSDLHTNITSGKSALDVWGEAQSHRIPPTALRKPGVSLSACTCKEAFFFFNSPTEGHSIGGEGGGGGGTWGQALICVWNFYNWQHVHLLVTFSNFLLALAFP